jgi:hypothetical protein
MDGFLRRCAPLALWIVVVLSMCTTGCNLQRLTVRQTADVLYAGSPALEREADPQFAREALPASLKTVETFLLSDPGNKKLLELLGKGFFSYAFGFLEWDLERGQYESTNERELAELNRRAVIHYLRARDYGFLYLDKPRLETAAKELDGETLDAELKKLDKHDVPGLFWAAYGWGGAINLSQNDADMVAALAMVEKMMHRVIELDQDYFYGGAHLFFGVLYSSRPEMFGGDPVKSKEHFDIAMERHGDYNMMVHYLMARFYAPTQQDRELFISTMEKVANANVEGHPNVRLNNEIARQRARWWLEHVDELIYE